MDEIDWIEHRNDDDGGDDDDDRIQVGSSDSALKQRVARRVHSQQPCGPGPL